MLKNNSPLFLPLYLLLSIITFVANPVCADEIIKGHYCYTYGDNETLKGARELTSKLAIRNAIEFYRIYVASASKIKDFHLTDDLINTISSGYLKNVKVTGHTEKEKTICESIEGQVNADEIDALIVDLRKKVDKKAQTVTSTKEYLFMISLLESLFDCQWAREMFRTDEAGDMMKMITDLTIQNNKFKKDHSSISMDINNDDPYISAISKGLSVGIEVLIDANEQGLKILEDITSKRNIIKGLADHEITLAKIQAQKKLGWDTIYQAASLGPDMIWDMTLDPKDRKGPVVFRITPEEINDLLIRIDRLFGDDINKFHTARKLQKEKKKHAPEDITSLIMGVIVIRDSLSVKNYGDRSSSLK
jgi:hypothetical protein